MGPCLGPIDNVRIWTVVGLEFLSFNDVVTGPLQV